MFWIFDSVGKLSPGNGINRLEFDVLLAFRFRTDLVYFLALPLNAYLSDLPVREECSPFRLTWLWLLFVCIFSPANSLPRLTILFISRVVFILMPIFWVRILFEVVVTPVSVSTCLFTPSSRNCWSVLIWGDSSLGIGAVFSATVAVISATVLVSAFAFASWSMYQERGLNVCGKLLLGSLILTGVISAPACEPLASPPRSFYTRFF